VSATGRCGKLLYGLQRKWGQHKSRNIALILEIARQPSELVLGFERIVTKGDHQQRVRLTQSSAKKPQ
jgi:hypothetical protein